MNKSYKHLVDRCMKVVVPLLKLRDWSVDVRIVNNSEISTGYLGECKWNLCDRTAEILLLHPMYYTEKGNLDRAFLETLVHELLHINVASMLGSSPKESSFQDTCIEQQINAIAECIVSLYLRAYPNAH